MEDKNESWATAFISIQVALTLLFAILRLTGIFPSPWIIITAPLWVPAAVCILFFLTVLIHDITRSKGENE